MTELEARDVMNGIILVGLPVPVGRIAWQDLPFSPDINSPWIRVTISHDLSRQLSFGTPGITRTFRRRGGIIVQAFVPAKDGSTDDVLAIAIAVKNLFEGNTIQGIRFYDAGVREMPPSDATWLQANAIVTFQYDERK